MSSSSDFLTISEVSKILRVQPITVRRMITRGELKAFRFGPRILRVQRSDLNNLGRQAASATFELVNGESL